jgi:hypothetical protein
MSVRIGARYALSKNYAFDYGLCFDGFYLAKARYQGIGEAAGRRKALVSAIHTPRLSPMTNSVKFPQASTRQLPFVEGTLRILHDCATTMS